MSALAVVSNPGLFGEDGESAPTRGPPNDTAATTRAARSLISALDFAEAQSSLDRFLDASPSEKEPCAKVLEEVLFSREAWSRLQKELQARKQDKKYLQLDFSAGAQPGPLAAKPFQVIDLSGCRLSIQAQGSKTTELRCVFTLRAEILGKLAGGAGGATPQDIEGLGLLVLFHRGPEAAATLLNDPSLPAARRAACAETLRGAADLWLTARLEAARARAVVYESASPSPSVDMLDFAAKDAAEIMAGWRSRPEYAKARLELRKLFSTHREEALKASPPERFFHAKEVKLKSGMLELNYDFSTPEQAEDFVTLSNAAGSVQWQKAQKTIRVKGEVRLKDGNPFRRRLLVSGKATGLDTTAQNVNIAFWTIPSDRLTGRFDGGFLSSWREKGGKKDEDSTVDFVLLGMGFRTHELQAAGGAIRSWLPLHEREPTFAIVTGTRMKRSLNGAAGVQDFFFGSRAEVLWDMASSNVLKQTSLSFVAGVDEKGKIQWSVNGKGITIDGNPDLKRLEPTELRKGSISLFTNGKVISFGPLKISGELDPEWATAQAKSLALAELYKLDGNLPVPKKKKITIEVDEPDPDGEK